MINILMGTDKKISLSATHIDKQNRNSSSFLKIINNLMGTDNKISTTLSTSVVVEAIWIN